ncbi:MAG: hypothetical protein ACRYF9_10405 [Janthinobacterium lividum]|uniref:hypothetical protein n=1 Tax=Pseudomonas TaxID=286 RepID=UPI001CFAC032|nr:MULTISPECIES: hypothetical protein [Pseudomonas]
MTRATNIVDLALHRKRRNAQQMGRALWALYEQRAGLATQAQPQPLHIGEAPRHA